VWCNASGAAHVPQRIAEENRFGLAIFDSTRVAQPELSEKWDSLNS
jgi:hypothetical protein